MGYRRARNVLAGVAAIVLVSACAGNSERADPRSYQGDLARAAASIEEAENAGANQLGSADLNRARAKLTAARKASDEGGKNVAQRLAIEAGLDADVAAATARNHEMQTAVAELQESIRTLQVELRRNEQRNLSRL